MQYVLWIAHDQIPILCVSCLAAVKKGMEPTDRGEREEEGDGGMEDSDSSDSDMIGPPLPPGYSAKRGSESAGEGPSEEQGGGDEGEGEDEDDEDDSVSLCKIA